MKATPPELERAGVMVVGDVDAGSLTGNRPYQPYFT